MCVHVLFGSAQCSECVVYGPGAMAAIGYYEEKEGVMCTYP